MDQYRCVAYAFFILLNLTIKGSIFYQRSIKVLSFNMRISSFPGDVLDAQASRAGHARRGTRREGGRRGLGQRRQWWADLQPALAHKTHTEKALKQVRFFLKFFVNYVYIRVSLSVVHSDVSCTPWYDYHFLRFCLNITWFFTNNKSAFVQHNSNNEWVKVRTYEQNNILTNLCRFFQNLLNGAPPSLWLVVVGRLGGRGRGGRRGSGRRSRRCRQWRPGRLPSARSHQRVSRAHR